MQRSGGSIPDRGRREFVFGYGSLTHLGEARPARLRGFRRSWGVAMDNAVDVPGYKRYLRSDGSRPEVLVAFLDLEETAGEAVDGVCVPVTPEALAALDARERNYERVDVTRALHAPPGRTWTYIGSTEGRARFRRGLESGRLVISREYLDRVAEGFGALGEEVRAAATRSLAAGEIPVWDLRRVEIPAG